MNLSSHTAAYAVLGHPIGHSLSPIMHNAAFRAMGMDAVYLAFDVRPDRIMTVLPAMRDMGFRGINLTVPLKQVAFEGLELKRDSASRLGAVNTIELRSDGALVGHNTDGAGFTRAVREAFARELKGLSVFVLGCGGAGRAVAITCASHGAAHLALADLETERAQRVRDDIDSGPGPRVDLEVCEAVADWPRASQQADLVVQATPVGMQKDDRSLLDSRAFHRGQMVFDLVYMYPDTAFTATARQAGANAANGIGMLLHQGAQAFTLWTGREPPVDVMRRELEAAVYGA